MKNRRLIPGERERKRIIIIIIIINLNFCFQEKCVPSWSKKLFGGL